MDGYHDDRGLLSGLRVLEMSEGMPGAVAGALLAGMGAEVSLAVWPEGHALERKSPFSPGGRSLYDVAFNHGKRRVSIMPGGENPDPGEVDAVIVEGPAARVQTLLTRISKPVVAITPFGLSGPRRDWKGSELVAQAYAGILFITGDPARSPVRIGVPIAEYAAGQAAAAALLSALVAGDDAHRQAEVSVVEAALSIMEHSFATWAYQERHWSRRGNHGQAAWGIYPCADGYVGVISGLGESWQRFRHLVGGPLLDDEYAEVGARAEHADIVHAAVLDWLSTRTKQQAFEEAVAARLPFSLLSTPSELLQLEQLLDRDYFDHIALEDREVALPGAPFKVSVPERVASK